MGEIYHTITGRFKPTEKESVLDCLNTVAQSGNEQLIDVLNLAAGLGVREAWAREIFEQHAACVRQTHNGNLRFESDHSGEVISWRAGEQVLLPSCCQRCDSSPDEARTRCPILFGNRLEIERVEGGVELNGERFRNVALDIGGGSLLEVFSLGRPGLDAVIVVDPRTDNKTGMPVSMVMQQYLREGNFAALADAIERDYIDFSDFREADVARVMNAIISSFRVYRHTELDIYHVNNSFEGLSRNLPEGVIGALVYCYPYNYQTGNTNRYEEIEVCASRFVELADHGLAPGGYLVLKSENYDYMDAVNHLAKKSGRYRVAPGKLTVPTSMYDVFWQEYYGQTGQSLVFQKL